MDDDDTQPSCNPLRRASVTLMDVDTTVSENPKDIYVWGNHINGELGVGGIEADHLQTPTLLPFTNKVVSVSCGESHTAFLLDDGYLWTCGSNDHGQLGHTKARTRPGRVEGLDGRTIVAVSAGYAHTLAIDIWGGCYTWGSDSHGQLGLGFTSAEQKIVPLPKMVKALALKAVVQIAAGHFHSLMLTSTGELYTCGSNSHGQLGLSFANGLNQSKPCQVDLLLGLPLSFIAAGGFHSFALSVSGSVFGWGKNNLGQLGVSDTEDKCKPTQLSTLRSLGVKYITAGIDHSAFLTQDGGVFTCGNGMYGQLGHSAYNSEVLPRKILEFGSVIIQVNCGRSHTLCLTDKNKLYSFGLGASGQLGIGNSANKNSPILLISLSPDSIRSIFCGGDQSFVMVSSRSPPALEGPSETSTETPCLPDPPSDYRILSPRSQIHHITDELLEQMCSAIEPIDQDIMTNAETIFASPAAWNCSFLLPHDGHMPSTWKNIGVDLIKAEATLSRLMNVKAQGLRDLVEQVIFKDLLPKLPHQLKHVEILRVYILLPLLPTFYSSRNYLIPVYFADRIQALSSTLINVVVRWYFDSPAEHLERLISVYKKAILALLDANQPKGQKDPVIRSCLQFLSLLHKHNKICLKLSYHTFTIPQLTDKFDIQQDYFYWIQEKNRARSPLYFCDYPFVFDAQAKTVLLQKPLRVKFVGEEAEDAGGVRKEFFLLLIREILDPKYGMFQYYEDSHLIWFSESALEDQIMYYLIGLLCGLAIYNFTIPNKPV